MPRTLVHDESPLEYFREMVESALQRQRLDVGPMTSFYVVNLLAGFVRGDRAAAASDEDALGVRLMKALQSAGPEQRDGLRRVGDQSLFISGFFSDSLNSGLVDVDYYMQVGGQAYASLARSDETFGEVFDELATKFGAVADVLAEVSERSALSSNTDLLRLYEKWLRTGSRRSGELLAARGIVPNASIGSRFIQ
jgi:hypothetical protein